MQKLARAGCVELQLGLEAGSNSVLEKMRKRRLFSVEQAQDVVRDAHDAGIRTALFIIVGFPGESASDFDETIAFVQRNANWIDEIKSINTLHVITGTDLHLRPDKYGIRLPERDCHYLWEGPNGNTEEERNRRAKELLTIADELKIPVRETNYREGKQYDLVAQWQSDNITSMPMRLESLIAQSKAIHQTQTSFIKSADSCHGAIQSTKPLQSDPIIAGIISGRDVYAGPELLEIDLTNNCNLQCIGCWCHSPLLGEAKFSHEKKKEHPPTDKVISIIEKARDLGTVSIQLAGAGEPFMHPGVWEIIRTIKKFKMRCRIVTNFTLLKDAGVQRLVDLGVDSITASIWAGDGATYRKTHPGSPDTLFDQLKRNLSLLTKTKGRGNPPELKLYHVINNENADNIKSMIDLGLDVGADAVEFQMVDVVRGKTESLLPDQATAKVLLSQFYDILNRDDYTGEFVVVEHLQHFKDPILIDELKEFGRLCSKLPKGFSYRPNNGCVRCPNGKESVERRVSRAAQISCTFVFDQKDCNQCPQKNSCWIDATEFGRLHVHFMEIRGAGSFLRRLTSSKRENLLYDRKIIDRVPCTVGWTYARVTVDGNVIPCCKASNFPIGNLHKDSFSRIWQSPVYSEFRQKAKELSKKDPYFKKINCYKCCDNLGMNLHTYLRVLDYLDK